MKIERTKNATRNIIFGILLKLYQIILPFIIRTAMIYIIGIECLGLSSLFASVLQVLNLAELGVGSAMVFSMYKPIALDDKITICALMRLYKIYYLVIGFVVLIGGIIFSPFLPHLISGTVPPNINLYIVYFLTLLSTVFSYWFFAYKSALLTAFQRVDIISKVTLVTMTLQYGTQIFVLWAFKNYYYFLITALVTQVLTNIITAIVATRMFPNYKPIGKLQKENIKAINKRIFDLFMAKLGGTITNSADAIIISSFIGLQMLAVYNNYFYIMSSVFGCLSIVFSACLAGIGNSLIVDSKEKIYADFKKFSFLISWCINIFTALFLCLYQPFMEIWVGKELMLDGGAVVLLCVYFYVYELAMIWSTYKDAGGIWHHDRFRPLIGALVNLFLNILMVTSIGIYGIVLSTIISCVFVNIPWLLHNLFKHLLNTSMKEYLVDIISYLLATILSAVGSYLLCTLFPFGNGMLGLLVRASICFIFSNIVFIFLFHKKSEFSYCTLMVRNLLNKFSAKG